MTARGEHFGALPHFIFLVNFSCYYCFISQQGNFLKSCGNLNDDRVAGGMADTMWSGNF